MAEYSREKTDILRYIDEWSGEVFGPTFNYRPGQKEAICDIVYSWLHNVNDVILDAPTGTGKSIIALSVAGILNRYYNKTGYILVSELSLMEQYDRDLEKYFPRWALLKGQQNYICNQNHLPFSSGVCQLDNCKTYGEIAKKYPDCCGSCEYIQLRQRAIDAPILVCTYSFWLLQQNYVKRSVMNPPFDDRDFVICDEAHKLQSIVQSHFSPKFGKEDSQKITTVFTAMSKMGGTDTSLDEILTLRNKIFREAANEKILELLKEYCGKLYNLTITVEKIKKETLQIAGDAGKMSKEDLNVLKACGFLIKHYETFHEYTEIIESIGTYSLIKNDSDNETITFNCLDESYLMKKFFHSNCEKKMYMSATIGDPEVFAHDVFIPGEKFYLKMPSVFDYTNSPIYFVKEYELSYKKKEQSLPCIISMIDYILTMYKDYRGIIQTGSYAFAKAVKDGVSDNNKTRILLYEDSATKSDSLEVYKLSKNRVLVGPSLVEGLSFDDDLCRFQIIMKVPYPSLADKFVSAKMNYDNQWYSNTTAISILQGVGRGVRNMHDWCVTFILDGCFLRLLHMSRSMFPQEFCERIKVLNSSTLLNP